MSDGMKTGLFLLAVLVIGVPLAGRLVRDEGEGQAASASDPPQQYPAAAPNSAPHRQGVGRQGQGPARKPGPRPAQGPPRQRARANKPRQLTAKDLAGTAWTVYDPQYGNVTVQFFSNMTAQAQSDKFPMRVEGRWSVSGSTVNVSGSAYGQSFSLSAQIVGDQLKMGNRAARRIR